MTYHPRRRCCRRLPAGDQRLLWVTDPHLEKAPQTTQDKILQRLGEKDYDLAVITGDIATSANLPSILPLLAEACGRRRLFVVLGNHDFTGAEVSETLTTVDGICRRHTNLTHLTTSQPLQITKHTTLVGHHGLTGHPIRRNQDTAESSQKILHGIFSARNTGTQLLAATHYPPFHTSALFNSVPCPKRKLSNFCNLPLGYLMIKMAKQIRHLPIWVFAGHTHHACEDAILPNLHCRVGRAGPGQTGVQGVVMV